MESSHYQGLWEHRQRQQQEQEQQEEEEEPQPFLMELVSVSTIYIALLCSHAATSLCLPCPEVRIFRIKRERERNNKKEIPASICFSF